MADGWGGARPGAGRPKGSKSTQTLLKEKALSEADEDARYALGLIIGWMRDEKQDDTFRRICAIEVLDRVWGKPTQHNVNENHGDIDAYIHWDD